MTTRSNGKKVAFVGFDDGFAAMEALANEGCQLLKLFTCQVDPATESNAQVIAKAQQLQIPYTTQKITRQDLQWLKDNGCQLLLSAAYYHKIPTDPTLPMVNIHPTCLPRGRGGWPTPVMILRGEKQGGVTFHKIASGFDTGDIILQHTFPLAEDEDLETLMAKVYRQIPPMVHELLSDFDRLYQNAKPQRPGEVYPTPTEADFTVTEQMPAQQIDRILRAFRGFPCLVHKGGWEYVLLHGAYHSAPPAGGPAFPYGPGYLSGEWLEKHPL